MGTVIDRNWIMTSATCCKRDEIVTIKFNDYSIFFPDDQEHQIISTLFHIHQDMDACLIRTAADMSEIVDKIPCLTKVCSSLNLDLPIMNPYRQTWKTNPEFFQNFSFPGHKPDRIIGKSRLSFFFKNSSHEPDHEPGKLIHSNFMSTY